MTKLTPSIKIVNLTRSFMIIPIQLPLITSKTKTKSSIAIAKRLVASSSTVAVSVEGWSAPRFAYAVSVTTMKVMKSSTEPKVESKRCTTMRLGSTTSKAAGVRGPNARRTTVSASSEDSNVTTPANAKNASTGKPSSQSSRNDDPDNQKLNKSEDCLSTIFMNHIREFQIYFRDFPSPHPSTILTSNSNAQTQEDTTKELSNIRKYIQIKLSKGVRYPKLLNALYLIR